MPVRLFCQSALLALLVSPMVPAVADDSQPAEQAAAEVDSAQGPLHRHEPSEKPDAQTTSEKQAEDKVEGEDGKPAKPTADELR